MLSIATFVLGLVWGSLLVVANTKSGAYMPRRAYLNIMAILVIAGSALIVASQLSQ